MKMDGNPFLVKPDLSVENNKCLLTDWKALMCRDGEDLGG